MRRLVRIMNSQHLHKWEGHHRKMAAMRLNQIAKRAKSLLLLFPNWATMTFIDESEIVPHVGISARVNSVADRVYEKTVLPQPPAAVQFGENMGDSICPF